MANAPIQTDVETTFKVVVSHVVNDTLRSVTFVFGAKDVEAANLYVAQLISQKKLKFARVVSVAKY